MRIQTVRITFILILSIILYHVFTEKGNCAKTGEFKNRDQLACYYSLLDSVQSDPSDKQIISLKSFLLSHPAFEQVYIRILERYLIDHQIIEARSYFETLMNQPLYKQNSAWMLAKIHMIQDDRVSAFSMFKEALQLNHPSIALLEDLARFLQQEPEPFRLKESLDLNHLNSIEKDMLTALLYHKMRHFRKAIQVLSKLPDQSTQNPTIQHIWGDCYYRLSQYVQADSLWRMGLGFARKNRDLENEGCFLTDLGVLDRVSGEYSQALCYYDSSYVILSSMGNLYYVQRNLGNRANIYYLTDRYLEAINQYKKAIKLAATIGLHDYLMIWNSNCARAHVQLGQFHDALSAFDHSEHFAVEAKRDDWLIELMLSRGDIYYYLNQHEMAKIVYQDAYAYGESLKITIDDKRIQSKLADLMVEEGEYQKARTAYQKYINILDKKSDLLDRAFWLHKIAFTYEKEGLYHDAKNYYIQAANTAKKSGSEEFQTTFMINIANIELVEGHIQKAIEIYQWIATQESFKNGFYIPSETYLGLGNGYFKKGDLKSAILAYKKAIEMIEKNRQVLQAEEFRIGYFSEQYKAYQQLVNCYFQRYRQSKNWIDLDSLFFYYQISHGRSLQEIVFQKNVKEIKKNFNDQYDPYLRACSQLRLIQRQIRDNVMTSGSNEQFNELLSRLEPAQYSLIAQKIQSLGFDQKNQPKLSNIPPLSQMMESVTKDNNMGLLLYHISDEASFVISISDGRLEVVQLQTNPNRITPMIDSLIAPFHHIDQNAIHTIPYRASIAYQLYQMLIKPVTKHFLLPEKLLIFPDYLLMDLPFELLLVEEPEKATYLPSDFPIYADHFLINNHSIAYNPGLFLQKKERDLKKNPKMIIIANPCTHVLFDESKQSPLRSRSGWCFDPLPFAEFEAEKIEEIYPHAQIIKRSDATKNNLAEHIENQHIVHVAAHAFVNNNFDAFSGLVLAAGEDSTDDGLLMGYEISDMNLKCDLVTLSGCETGCGRIIAGEGILGLPRLFIGAGVKTVIMTLWKVDDRFSSILMPEFYRGLLKRHLSESDALTRAKRLILHSQKEQDGVFYQHPFYWSSYLLYGKEGGTIFYIRRSNSFVIILLILLFILCTFFSVLIVRKRKYIRHIN